MDELRVHDQQLLRGRQLSLPAGRLQADRLSQASNPARPSALLARRLCEQLPSGWPLIDGVAAG